MLLLVALHAAGRTMVDALGEVKQLLGIVDPVVPKAIMRANQLMGLPAVGSLPAQVNALADRLGIAGSTAPGPQSTRVVRIPVHVAPSAGSTEPSADDATEPQRSVTTEWAAVPSQSDGRRCFSRHQPGCDDYPSEATDRKAAATAAGSALLEQLHAHPTLLRNSPHTRVSAAASAAAKTVARAAANPAKKARDARAKKLATKHPPPPPRRRRPPPPPPPPRPLSATPFFCCLRYIHIGKAGGTSVEEWVRQGRSDGVQIGGPDKRDWAGAAERTITFHHPFEWFSCRRSWEAPCVRGTSLRDPVDRFRSAVAYARSQGGSNCGFVRVDHGTELADCWCSPPPSIEDKWLHAMLSSRIRRERDGALAHVLDDPEALRRNANHQTAYLGMSLEDLSSAPVRRCSGDTGRRFALNMTGQCAPLEEGTSGTSDDCRTFEGGVRQIWRECAWGLPRACEFSMIFDPQLALQGNGPGAEAAGRAMLDRATARLEQLDFVAITSTLDADMEAYFPGHWGRHHKNDFSRRSGAVVNNNKSALSHRLPSKSSWHIAGLDTGDTARGVELIRRLNWLDVELVRRARAIRDAKLARGALRMVQVELDGAQWTPPGAPPLRCLAPQWEGRPTAAEIEGGAMACNGSHALRRCSTSCSYFKAF